MGLQYFGRENGRGDNAKERQGPDHSGLCKGREFGIYCMSSIKLWNGFILLRDMSWCVCMLSHFSHIWLFAAPWTVALPGFSVHGIIQARILEWLPFPPTRDIPDPGIKTSLSYVSFIGRRILSILSHLGSPEQRFLSLICITWEAGFPGMGRDV